VLAVPKKGQNDNGIPKNKKLTCLYKWYYYFSNTIEQHCADLIKIINFLQIANLNISLEKSKFFKLESAFLGNIVSHKV